MPHSTSKRTIGASYPASCVSGFKTKAGAGVGGGTPAPQLPLLRQNLVRANFAALLKERTKNQRMSGGGNCSDELSLLKYKTKI